MVTIKICGLTNLLDAESVLGAGADYLGFVLYAGSPRCVTPVAVKRMVEVLPGNARPVGVFVNERPQLVEQIVQECHLHAIQLHGEENAADFEDMPVPVWRAVRFQNGRWSPDPALWHAERFVIDAAAPGMYGGSGNQADWTAAAAFAGRYPTMLAGGLTPENVGEAIRHVSPLGVDVCSGVEHVPGKKDAWKTMEFIARARAAAERIGPASAARRCVDGNVRE